MHRLFVRNGVLVVVAVAGTMLTGTLLSAAERPNIVLIMADDMGYSDIGCYGGEIRTPHLDRLAADGLRFTQFYNTARCCPTRASLLTGLYPHQAGVGWMMNDNGVDGYRGNLNDKCLTIAEALRPAGYATWMAGKWHVTRHVDPDGPNFNWPLQRGFDRFYGTIHGAGSFFDPNTLMRDNTMISPAADPEYQPETFYYTDAISDHATRFIREHNDQQSTAPFFLYVAYTAAHWPMHALPEDIARYKGKYDNGYGAIRQARLERMQQIGVLDAQARLSPQAMEWDDVPDREWEIRCMEVYAAMVDRMDQGIGRIIDSLRETNRIDNTLILFCQDNGGCAEGLGRKPAANAEWTSRPDKPPLPAMSKTALQPDMIPKQTRDGFPVVKGPGIMPGPADTYIAYGKGWANTSNTPFREYKHWVHEGGISTPLIAHWPAGINRAGEYERQPSHLIDIMATCVDLAGTAFPTMRNDVSITPLAGRSLRPIFDGQAIERDAIFWEHEGNRAVRAGKWKLVAKGATGPWELYDIDVDRSELNDLATQFPERVQELSAKWQTWAERSNVLPLTPYYNNDKAANTEFSRRKRFRLTHGDTLLREDAPHIDGVGFRIAATVSVNQPAGVIVAQGGDAHGYMLTLDGGRLVFGINRHGKLSVVRSDQPIPTGTHNFDMSLAIDGTVTLKVDGRVAGRTKLDGPIAGMPIDGLQVGEDSGGTVGHYDPPNPLQGHVDSLVIEIDRARAVK